jgi:hypothetical protein
MRHILIRGLPRSTTFIFTLSRKRRDFRVGGESYESKIRDLILSTNFV